MLTRELAETERIARSAGAIVLEHYGKVTAQMKGREDPVTEADRRANAFIVEQLTALFPGDGIVAEESPLEGSAQRKQRCWFVDPLDGTKEFLAQNGEFSIMIGLAIDGRAQLGVVYQPVLDKLYAGIVGQAATLAQGGARKPLEVSSQQEPSKLRLVVSRSHRSADIDQLMQRLGIHKETPSGSVGLKVGHIAEQNAELYVHMSDRSSRWDACAPDAILHAAGGRFTDVLGEPLNYASPGVANTTGIFACNAVAYEAVLPVVKALALETGFATPNR